MQLGLFIVAYLCFRSTRPASLQLACGAFVNERVGTRMAHVAVPDNNGCIGLDDLEVVLAVYWGGHFDVKMAN